MDLSFLDIPTANSLLSSGRVSSEELTRYYLDRIRDFEDLGSFLTITLDEAIEQARQSDARRRNQQSIGPFDGLPVALKDLILTKELRTTAASKYLDNFIPPYDATVTRLLRQSGAVIMGKTNLDEFAMGSSTENSGFMVTKNPWDTDRVPGGSSGGSAAALAADQCIFALGTDTGGSIRQPASWTGTVGFKPTYGLFSRYGVISMASSLDQVGTFTRTAHDALSLVDLLAKPDQNDSTSDVHFNSFSLSASGKLRGIKVGIPDEFFDQGIDVGVAAAVRAAIDQMSNLGAEIKPVSLPLLKKALAVYYILVPAEVSTNLERYDGIRYGYRYPDERATSLLETYLKSRGLMLGPEVKRRIVLGTFVLSAGYYDAYYAKALKVRNLIKMQFDQIFEQVDVLAGPVTPVTPFVFGDGLSDPLKMYLADVMTVPVNIAGLPGVSVPCGLSDNLPVGLQLIGNRFDDKKLLSIAGIYENSVDWDRQHPNL